MPLLTNLLVAALGVLLGGVANVLADDLPHHRPSRQPRCPHCEHIRHPAAWLGLGAVLLGKRRCPACSRPLPWRHPALEIVVAAAWLYLWNRHGLTSDGLFAAAYVWIALLVAVIDLEHRLIPHVVMGPALWLALSEAALTPRLPFLSAVRGGAVGFAFVFGIYLLGEGLRRLVGRLQGKAIGEVAFGFGDVTLATFAGLVVGDGPGGIGLVLTIMIVAGGVGALSYLVYHRLIRRDYSLFTAIPYGPNIILGMLVVLLWREQIGEGLRRLFLGGAG